MVDRTEQTMVAASAARLAGLTAGRMGKHLAGPWAGVKAAPMVDLWGAKMADLLADATVGPMAGP